MYIYVCHVHIYDASGILLCFVVLCSLWLWTSAGLSTCAFGHGPLARDKNQAPKPSSSAVSTYIYIYIYRFVYTHRRLNTNHTKSIAWFEQKLPWRWHIIYYILYIIDAILYIIYYILYIIYYILQKIPLRWRAFY